MRVFVALASIAIAAFPNAVPAAPQWSAADTEKLGENLIALMAEQGVVSMLYVAPEESVAVFAASNDDSASMSDFVRVALEALFPGRKPPSQ